MDRVDLSRNNIDLDVDLESGGTTSEEDSSNCQPMFCENSRNLSGMIKNGSSDGLDSTDAHDNMLSSQNKVMQSGNIGEQLVSKVEKAVNKKKPARPPKPPRPPRGPSLNAFDLKLLKEISEINIKRKKLERGRTLKKIKKDKASSRNYNLFAFLVTIIFFLVIISQGLLGSRT